MPAISPRHYFGRVTARRQQGRAGHRHRGRLRGRGADQGTARGAIPRRCLLGEETGTQQRRRWPGIWVVDPIDGTQPFLSGMSTGAFRSPTCKRRGAAWPGPQSGSGRTVHRRRRAPRRHSTGGQSSPPRMRAPADGITALGYIPASRPGGVVPVLERLLRAGGMFFRNGSGALGLCDSLRPAARLRRAAHQPLGLPRGYRSVQVGRGTGERLSFERRPRPRRPYRRRPTAGL